MIIIKMQGGLGNQMLQYSIGKIISLKYPGKKVLFDMTFYQDPGVYTKRPYMLDKFTTSVVSATTDEIEKTRYPYGFFSKVGVSLYKVVNRFFIKKYYVGYDASFLKRVASKDNMYLEGYWQSFSYYKEYIRELRNDFTLLDESNVNRARKDSGFETCASVAVHVRRGDYVSQGPNSLALGKDYYIKAADFFNRELPGARYYIFSDDVEWVKQELGHLFKNAVYVNSYNLKDFEEFFFMSKCDHAIIANSTFSWLAAVLSYSLEKKVTYPKIWNNSLLKIDENLCPKDWVAL